MPGADYQRASHIQKQLEAPMPWIGMYVAVASVICSLAMAADVFNGFRSKKYWFPSKYFSINAASLTLLAVTVKLPVDLTTRMFEATDRLAKVNSLLFLSTAIGNFMTSLGSMDDKEILMNVTALGILVITVLVNVGIQIIQMRHFLAGRELFAEEIIACLLMLMLLFMLVSSAIMVSKTKEYLERKYHEMLKMASDEELVESVEGRNFATDKLRKMAKKYWVMAETSSPQFVIARSVTCTASCIICLLIVFVLAEAHIRMAIECKTFRATSSTYGWSTNWIVVTQSIGVIVGTIAPTLRWFAAINFKHLEKGQKSFNDEFKIETYWTHKLVEWKQSPLPLQIKGRRWRKFFQDMKGFVLNFAIGVQIISILACKLVRFISVYLTNPIFSCFHCIKRLKNSSASRIHVMTESASGYDLELDLSRYVLLLEGEAALPENTLKNICNEVHKMIQIGKDQKPASLVNLLQSVSNLGSVRELENYQVPYLHSQGLPSCWSLPLVTLTSIAVAIPNVPKENINWLLSSMNEGLSYVKLVEKSLDKDGNLVNLRNAADVVWVAVELYHKWQDNDLHEASLRGKNYEEVLQELSSIAERTMVEFRRDVKDCLMENPVNWPVKIVAANSMYKISETILLACQDDPDQTDVGLFKQLTLMIADLLAACFIHLPRVITCKCHHNGINEREESVREAAVLFGETEEILTLLQQHRAQRSGSGKSAY